MHGGGWVLGNADTHDRLVRELAVGTGAAVVFVEYDRSPEAHYPVAIEQGYATAQWIVRNGSGNGLDPDRMAVAGGVGRRVQFAEGYFLTAKGMAWFWDA